MIMIHNGKIGYKRDEFRKIFQVYSHYVYKGLFKDFSFAEIDGRYYISFREDAGNTPLITIEKRKLSADRALFVATAPNGSNTLTEIVRSEKIDSFVEQLKAKIEKVVESRKNGQVVSFSR